MIFSNLFNFVIGCLTVIGNCFVMSAVRTDDARKRNPVLWIKFSMALLNIMYGALLCFLPVGHTLQSKELISSLSLHIISSSMEFCICTSLWNVCLMAFQVNLWIFGFWPQSLLIYPVLFLGFGGVSTLYSQAVGTKSNQTTMSIDLVDHRGLIKN